MSSVPQPSMSVRSVRPSAGRGSAAAAAATSSPSPSVASAVRGRAAQKASTAALEAGCTYRRPKLSSLPSSQAPALTAPAWK
eukprot:8443908-Alexandrium_andersonii.AAC.1